MQNSSLMHIKSKNMTTLLSKNFAQPAFTPYVVLSQGYVKTTSLQHGGPILTVKLFGILYGTMSVLRLYGIGFTAEFLSNKLMLKVGFSIPLTIEIPKDIHVRLKNDERKKPNII
jgi:hypothetical protein